jgi:hypothetical protein
MSRTLTDEEFIEAQKHAGIAARYRRKDVHLFDFIPKASPFYKWASDRDAIRSHFASQNLLISDESGNGVAVCNLLARILLLFEVPVRIVSIDDIARGLETDYQEIVADLSSVGVVVLLGMSSTNTAHAPQDPFRIEWLLRKLHGAGLSFIFHTEGGSDAMRAWWSNGFVASTTNQTPMFKV